MNSLIATLGRQVPAASSSIDFAAIGFNLIIKRIKASIGVVRDSGDTPCSLIAGRHQLLSDRLMPLAFIAFVPKNNIAIHMIIK